MPYEFVCVCVFFKYVYQCHWQSKLQYANSLHVTTKLLNKTSASANRLSLNHFVWLIFLLPKRNCKIALQKVSCYTVDVMSWYAENVNKIVTAGWWTMKTIEKRLLRCWFKLICRVKLAHRSATCFTHTHTHATEHTHALHFIQFARFITINCELHGSHAMWRFCTCANKSEWKWKYTYTRFKLARYNTLYKQYCYHTDRGSVDAAVAYAKNAEKTKHTLTQRSK